MFAHATSNAFLVEILIVDWLNLIGSIEASETNVSCLLVLASPKPDAAIIVPFSEFVKRTCKPKRVTKLSLIPSFKLIVSSSLTL